MMRRTLGETMNQFERHGALLGVNGSSSSSRSEADGSMRALNDERRRNRRFGPSRNHVVVEEVG